MKTVKCCDIARKVLDEASGHFFPKIVDERKHRLFKESCGMIDEMAEEFGGISCEVEIDGDTGDISVTLISYEFEAATNHTRIYPLMWNTKSFSFAPEGMEYVRSTFTFEGIWTEAEG